MNNQDYIQASIEILAWKLARPKTYPFCCATCNDETKKAMNCSMESSDKIVLNGDNFDLTTCPQHYILPQHIEFLDKYFYLQEFSHTAPIWEHQDKLFWQWYCSLKTEYQKQENEEMKERMKSKK